MNKEVLENLIKAKELKIDQLNQQNKETWVQIKDLEKQNKQSYFEMLKEKQSLEELKSLLD